MSKFVKAALASSVLAASVMGANTAHAATDTATATANILEQVTVTSDGSDLDFATIASGTAASTVIVSAAATAVRTCGAGLVCSDPVSAAGFGMGGAVGQTVSIDADANVSLTNGTGGTMSATLTESATSHVLTGVAATDVFYVGGSLAVNANQADGAYSGTFTVTVNYQ